MYASDSKPFNNASFTSLVREQQNIDSWPIDLIAEILSVKKSIIRLSIIIFQKSGFNVFHNRGLIERPSSTPGAGGRVVVRRSDVRLFGKEGRVYHV